MGAIFLWVRATLRRNRGATLFLVLLTGLTAGLVATTIGAANRAGSATDRFLRFSNLNDVQVEGCPPGIRLDEVSGLTEWIERCSNPALTRQLQGLIDGLDGVRSTSVGDTPMVAVVDPAAPNGWGHASLVFETRTPGNPLPTGNPIMVAGRLPHDDATDEIVVGEGMARVLNIHVGDVLNLAGWRTAVEELLGGSVPPETEPVPTRVVGVVRGIQELQTRENIIIGQDLFGGLYAGPGWANAHSDTITISLGAAVGVRLTDGARGVEAFNALVANGPGGWDLRATPGTGGLDGDLASVRRPISVERTGVLILAAIALVAGLGFVGLTLLRQFRRELGDRHVLEALGFTRRDIMIGLVARAVAVALAASIVAVVMTIALSPLAPLGTARLVEPHRGVRIDWMMHLATVAALVVFVVGLGAVASLTRRIGHRRALRPGRIDDAAGRLGVAPQVGASFIRGGATRVAAGVTAIAVATVLTAGVTVASFNRKHGQPARFGATWDYTVGQFTSLEEETASRELVRNVPGVERAAAFVSVDNGAGSRIDDKPVVLVALEAFIGSVEPIVIEGRAPQRDDEIALGTVAAGRLGKGLGASVHVAGPDGETDAKVVGIVVIDNPAPSAVSPGDVALATRPLTERVGGSIGGNRASSLLVWFKPGTDLAAAGEHLRDAGFGATVLPPRPDTAIENVNRLQALPWAVVGLIAVLSAATLIHALLGLLRRHRRDLATLSALGFDRRQQGRARATTTLLLALIGTVIGLPVGLIAGRRAWRYLAEWLGVVPGARVPWLPAVIGPIGACLIALVVATLAGRGLRRTPIAYRLRVE